MSKRYRTIDRNVAEAIRRLHKKYPRLGHAGLLKVLHSERLQVDSEELTDFLTRNRIRPEKPVPPVTFRGVSRYFVGHQFTAGRLKGTAEDD
jgi:hypothetical protein